MNGEERKVGERSFMARKHVDEYAVRRNVSLSRSLDAVMRGIPSVNWSRVAVEAFVAECRKRSPEFEELCVAREQAEEARRREELAQIIASGVV